MNFAALQPEINSGLMYVGPGSGAASAAAAAWDGIAAELGSAAATYGSVISALTSGSWLGPSSAAMAAAVAPYAGWLASSAGRAEQTAAQARSAAAAYETAFAMTVPPPMIAANRAQLAALVATNIFGQNMAAIAATEAQYGEMWAQDVAAMYGYAVAATAATELTPFAPPPQTTDPAGPAARAAAVAHAAGSSAGTGAQAALSQLAPAVLAAPAQAAPPAAILPPVITDFAPLFTFAAPPLAASALATASASWNSATVNNRILLNNSERILDNGDELHLMEREMLELLRRSESMGGLASAATVGPGAGGGAVPVSAATGQAVSAGKLSVPLSWAAAAPEIRTVAYALTGTSVGAAPVALAGSPGTAFSQMALAGMGGSALAGTVGRREPASAIPGGCVKSHRDEPGKPPQRAPESPVTEIVSGILELGALRDSGLLTAEEFKEQKQRLLCLPLR